MCDFEEKLNVENKSEQSYFDIFMAVFTVIVDEGVLQAIFMERQILRKPSQISGFPKAISS